MNTGRHWRAVVAVLMMALLPLQGLAAAACPHGGPASAAVVAEAGPACHEAQPAEDGTPQPEAGSAVSLDCKHCLHCLLGHALAGTGPLAACAPGQAAAAPSDFQPMSDAERRGLERPPKAAG